MSVSVSSSGVSAGSDVPAPDIDFLAISNGSEHFLARAKALADLKSEQQLAFMNLRLGTDAQAALEDAKRQQVAANADREQAGAALDAAKKDAAKIVAQARQDAAELVNKAQLSATATTDAARMARSDADDYAAQQKAKADAALKRATDMEAAAALTQQVASGALANHQTAQAAADKARSPYEVLSKSLQAKVAGLQLSIRQEIAR